jgi:hypothetical protein
MMVGMPQLKSGIVNRTVELQHVRNNPRVFYCKNFATAEESLAVIERAEESRMLRASLVRQSGNSGKGQVDRNQRTSTNYFDDESPLARQLMRRFFSLLRIPFDEALADGLQVVKYLPGQAYIGHKDYYEPTDYPWVNLDPRVTGAKSGRPGAPTDWRQGSFTSTLWRERWAVKRPFSWYPPGSLS